MSDLPDIPDLDDFLELVDEVVTRWEDPVDDVVADAQDLTVDHSDADPGPEPDPEVVGVHEVGLDVVALVDVPPEEPNGAYRTEVLADALQLAGLPDLGDLLAAAGGEVETRGAVAALDESGVGARVEHSSVGDLVERLSAGGEVLLGGGAAAHAIVAIDRDGTMVVEPISGGGTRFSVALDHFESMWDALANEAMVVETPGGLVSLGPGEVVVLPLGLEELAVVGGI